MSVVTAQKAESWSFVTAYKAASSYVGVIIARLMAGRGIENMDLADAAFFAGLPEAEYCIQGQYLLETPGLYFGPFRDSYIGRMPALAKTNIVAHLRDPRDCLVSNYYSLAFSHILPGEGTVRDEFIAQREHTARMSVDEYVLEDVKTFLPIFVELLKIIKTMPNVYISRYEEMVGDFEPWLNKLADYLECGDLVEIKSKILNGANFQVAEDQFKHKRQVQPGDYKRKLAPDVQQELTRQLESVLAPLGYV